MLHIFVDPAQMQGDLLRVMGKDVNHIKNVLRLRPGDEISVNTPAGIIRTRLGVELYESGKIRSIQP